MDENEALLFFKNAINKVDSHYYNQNEGVFCYELYHQLRKSQEENGQNWENVSIDGELLKDRITDEEANEKGIVPLDGRRYPDFLMHQRDNANFQLLVAEVKTTPDLERRELKKDGSS